MSFPFPSVSINYPQKPRLGDYHSSFCKDEYQEGRDQHYYHRKSLGKLYLPNSKISDLKAYLEPERWMYVCGI